MYTDTLVDNRNNTLQRTSTDRTLYPTDFQYNPAGQAVSWPAARPAGPSHCAVTQGSMGAPASTTRELQSAR